MVAHGATHDAEVKDLSSSGICLTSPYALDEMSLVRLDFELPGIDGTHRVEGVVVRCAKLRDRSPPTYEVALFFAQLADDARAAIHRFVSKRLEDCEP